MKVVTAAQLKKLPEGMTVHLIHGEKKELLTLVKSGRKKMLRGSLALHEIKDRPGWRYEVEE